MPEITVTDYDGLEVDAESRAVTVTLYDGGPGPAGPTGPAGADGADGADGASAYEVAVAAGFVGNEAAWLASLVGADGEPGSPGAPGADGESAYEVAVANGFVGTEAAWLASLVGPEGPQGEQGIQGAPGADGADGALGWFVVTEYGATGDGSTDDTSAINSAIAAYNTAGGGVLYFPAGDYKTAGGLTPITEPGMILGDGCGDVYNQNVASRVTSSSATNVLLTIASNGVQVQGLGLVNLAAATPTAGAGIQVTAGDGLRLESVYVFRFWIDVDIIDGAEWYMTRCFIYGPVKYGLSIQHADLPDGGDQGVVNNQFIAYGDADAAVFLKSGGGLRFVGNKINYRSGHFAYGIDASIEGATSVMTVVGNSFENVSVSAIRGRIISGVFGLTTITGNEFAHYGGTGPAIDITGWDNLAIVGNTGVCSPARSQPFIKLADVNGAAVGLNRYSGWSAELAHTGSTGISTATGVDASRTLTAGAGLTGGGDLSADRTFAVDFGTGAGEVAEGNHTHDGLVGGGSGEVLMQDGVAGPPVPTELEDRSDWLYQG